MRERKKGEGEGEGQDKGRSGWKGVRGGEGG